MARVLVVDDQRIPRTTVAGILEEAGHEVAGAESGSEGLQLSVEWSPDVIVLDVHMPGMDGFEVVERLKRDPRTRPIPVIFLTAEPPTDQLVVRGLDLGAYDFLGKDCSRAELLARVGVMARIKRGNDELSAIARMSDTLIQTLDPRELSSHFVEQVREIFRADAVLLRHPADPGDPPLHSASGLDPGDPLTHSLAIALLDQESAKQRGSSEVDLTALRGAPGVTVRRAELRSAIAARVEEEGRAPSLLAVFSRREKGFVRDSDRALLHLLARQARIALDNALLHARTRRQARKMEEQASQLERAMSERSRFFASMSHELRTPINAVIGYNQLLEYGTYGPLTDAQADAVERVSRSAHHLLDLINDVLDISKIEAGKLVVSIEETDLAEVLRDTVTSVDLQASEKNLSLRIEAPESVRARTDPARVRQILLNLLSNAVKFTSEGGVTATLLVEPSGAVAEIRVTDTGPGIAPEDRERIFEEFEQTQDSVARGGTGLGLAISRRLAHLLGGTLELESEVGVGSTFVLRIPLTPPEKAGEPQAGAELGVPA